MNLANLLIMAKDKFPKKAALKSSNSTYTYQEFYEYSVILYKKLYSQFNISGKTVIVHASNCNEYVILVNSLLFSNCTIVPVSTLCSDYELSYILNETNPTLIFIDEYTEQKYRNIYSDLKNIININQLENEYFQLISNEDYLLNNALLEVSNDIAFIMYSSGSTGEIKGVMCTHESILFAITRINEVIPNTDKDIVLCALPFSFDYGLYQIFLVTNAFSTAFIVNSNINPLQIPGIIKKNNITGFPAVPMWLNILFDTGRLDINKLSSLKYLTSTGDTLRIKISSYLQDKIPNIQIFPMYGLTECKRVSIMSSDQFKKHKDSVGLPLRGTKTRVVDYLGKDMPVGEAGELVVSGPHLMAGYYKDEILTREKYKYNSNTGEIELYTGDIFKKDSEGYLYFLSRTQFYIKKRGQRISPLVIEAHINELQGVIDSVIVPFRKDNEYEDLIICFVRVNCEVKSDDIEFLMKNLIPPLYRPDQIIFYKSNFPYSSNGKINRKMLIEIAKRTYRRSEGDRGLNL